MKKIPFFATAIFSFSLLICGCVEKPIIGSILPRNQQSIQYEIDSSGREIVTLPITAVAGEKTWVPVRFLVDMNGTSALGDKVLIHNLYPEKSQPISYQIQENGFAVVVQ